MKKFNSIIVPVIFYYLLITGVLLTVGGIANHDEEGRIHIVSAVIWLIGTTSLVGAGVIRAIQNSNSLRLSEATEINGDKISSDDLKKKINEQLKVDWLRVFYIGFGFMGVLLLLALLDQLSN
jgi:hypothetical protein